MASGLTIVAKAARSYFFKEARQMNDGQGMIKAVFPIGLHWPTQEPFLFCAHHLDLYPRGNGAFGPDASLLAGREMGSDFREKDGFRMYHGKSVPGFPVHPHRGFETITVVRTGYADHADSLGSAGRYGQGDVQWMTAGSGVQHSEMFPLIRTDADNHLELFQIWLNLPRKNKMAAPHYKMFWSEQIPRLSLDGGKVEMTLIAGNFENKRGLPPPPDSWAAEPGTDVAVQIFRFKSGGRLKLPASEGLVSRNLYLFAGGPLRVAGRELAVGNGVELDSRFPVDLEAATDGAEILFLQGKPIAEPVVQHGPFVMNTREEIFRAIQDYQRTRFGGWPWSRPDVVHGDKIERFAQYPDGRIERPPA